MKQPELGYKIAQLRKEKALTQEELVEKCNVTVRTIQRIEAGEVTPRPSTLRLIFDALNIDFDTYIKQEEASQPEEYTHTWQNRIRQVFIFDPSYYINDSLIAKGLQISWLAGVFYFILGFAESGFEYLLYQNELAGADTVSYIVIKALRLIAAFFFFRGFVLAGHKANNKLLLFGANFHLYIILVFNTLSLAVPLLGINSLVETIKIGEALCIGASGIILGIGLMRLEGDWRRKAILAGSFEVLAGLVFMSVVFSWMGPLLLIPAELLEIYLVYCLYSQMTTSSFTNQ